MKTCRLVTSIGVLALLAGCAVLGEGMSNNNPPDIKSENVHFVIANSNNGGPELSITNLRNAKCTKFPDEDRYRKGCVFAALNEMVIARLTLTGLAGWYFDEFQICDVVTLEKPQSFANCTLTVGHREEWLVIANGEIARPDQSGRVNISQLGTGLREFQLLDSNWSESDYFYRVQACTGTGRTKSCVPTDPGWENKGNNGN